MDCYVCFKFASHARCQSEADIKSFQDERTFLGYQIFFDP